MEEVWLERFPGEESSVHLVDFPDTPAEWRDEALAAKGFGIERADSLNAAARKCVVVAGLVIGWTGWLWVDPVLSLAIVVVIANDLGWGMIRHSQEIRIGHAIEAGTFIGRVDYHKMVEAIGGKVVAIEGELGNLHITDAASGANDAGCGSQPGPSPNPSDGPVGSHGIGTRHPSRPLAV